MNLLLTGLPGCGKTAVVCRAIVERVEDMPSVREFADPEPYNEVLEAMSTFRQVHYGWAQQYIQRWVDDPRGTGGTPYLQWLQQLIDETRWHRLA